MLLSDVTAGVEDVERDVGKLQTVPGPWMRAFETDYDPAKLALDGIELHSIAAGKTEYALEMPDVCKEIVDNINDRFCTLLSCPVLKSAVVFEHARWPGFTTARVALETFGDAKAPATPRRPPSSNVGIVDTTT